MAQRMLANRSLEDEGSEAEIENDLILTEWVSDGDNEAAEIGSY